MPSFLIWCPICVQFPSHPIPGISLQPVGRNEGNFCIVSEGYHETVIPHWCCAELNHCSASFSAVEWSKQEGTECENCTSLQCQCCAPDSQSGVLGTFKFITKCVVCIIIADFLKNLSLPLIVSPLHKPASLLFSECSLQWLLNTPSISSELCGFLF